MLKNKFLSFVFAFTILLGIFGISNKNEDNVLSVSKNVDIQAVDNQFTASVNSVGRDSIKFTIFSIPEEFVINSQDVTGETIYVFSANQHADNEENFPDNANINLYNILDNGDQTYDLFFEATNLDSSTTYEITTIYGWYSDSNNPNVWIPFSDGDGNNEIQLINEDGTIGISGTTKMSQGFFIGIIVIGAIILILLIVIIVIFIIRFREYSKTKEKYDLLNKEI